MAGFFRFLQGTCVVLNWFWFGFIGYALFQRDGWINLFNPFFDLMVLWHWLTTPVSWILVAGMVLFGYAAAGAESGRGPLD